MPIHNIEIARVFEEIADLLELEEADPFRVRAYRNAGRAVAECGCELSSVLANGGPLPKIPGVGTDLAAKITEICHTGSCALQQRLRGELPAVITSLLAVPGLGPKRVQRLYRELGVSTPEQLQEAARRGAVSALSGFGATTERKILESLAHRLDTARRQRKTVAPNVQDLLDYLRALPGVLQVAPAGSFRRGCETVGDLDIVVAANTARAVCEAFTRFEDAERVLSQGPTRASVVLRSGLQVDLRAVEPAAFGAALLYFTGSKAHNIALRRLAQGRGLKINEYGLYRGRRRLAGAAESDLYGALGLPYIEPELRENRGEIEAALAGHLPRLVSRSDLRGDLHLHTDASDGHADLRAMVLGAKAIGLKYVAVTDHSQHLTVARGLNPARLRRQGNEIEALRREHPGIAILRGIEVDILRDGSLDLPDTVLASLDIVVGAVHSHFDLPRAEQTARLLRALNHPLLDILAHPTGRLLGQRAACDMDLDAVMRAAAVNHRALELNGQPDRLDLNDIQCRSASLQGVKICINSDAHGVDGLNNLDYGVTQARRGWLSPSQVLNTHTLAELGRWQEARAATKPG